MKKNIVFIARSMDGFIAGKNGELDWLHSIPNPEGNDMGYGALMQDIDAIVMGKTTFETVMGFEGPWPYSKPVYVLSRSMKEVPEGYQDKIKILYGSPKEILQAVHSDGIYRLYIDGGRTVQNFISAGLIDELRVTTIPILLGGGFPLFGELEKPIELAHIKTEVFLGQVVQSHYRVVAK